MLTKEELQSLSIHATNGWQTQFQRIIRYLRILQTQKIDYSNWKDINAYLDVVITCFQNIFHLKDWLLNSTTLSNTELNKFIKQHKELGLCRDICNGTKHFEIKHHASIDKNFMIVRAQDPAYLKNKGPEYFILILSKAGIHQPFAFAKKCLQLWSDFIIEKNIASKNKLYKLRRNA